MDGKNEALTRPPKQEELEKAIKTIPKDSSPGPDGFGFGFYFSCWDIIK